MQKTVITDATIVCVDEDNTILEGDLLIEDGRIALLGDLSEERTRGARVINASGCAVIPGFVQTHVHLCQVLMRNSADDMVLIDWLRNRIWPYEAALDFDDLYASARLGLAELILGGTTTLLDMGTVRHTDAVGRAVAESGIRAFIGKCMMDDGEEVPAPLLEETSDSLRESRALFERWNGAEDGRIRYAFAPRFAVSCTEELLRDVAGAAEDLGAFIHTHASETTFENEYTTRRWGCSNMAYMDKVGLTGDRTVFAHGVHVSDEDCAILSATKSSIAHCPSANLKLASGIANIPRYDQFGVQVSLGADGAPCNNNLDAFIEMRLAALLQKPIHGPTAMPAERVLRLATLDGARALGLEDEIGSIEVGKSADLVVIDLDSDPGTNPGGSTYSRIVYGAHRANVRHVFASGVQLVNSGELAGVDLGAVIHESKSALGRVTARMTDLEHAFK